MSEDELVVFYEPVKIPFVGKALYKNVFWQFDIWCQSDPCVVKAGCFQSFEGSGFMGSFDVAKMRYMMIHEFGWGEVKDPNGYSDLMICPECVKVRPKKDLIKYKKKKGKKAKK